MFAGDACGGTVLLSLGDASSAPSRHAERQIPHLLRPTARASAFLYEDATLSDANFVPGRCASFADREARQSDKFSTTAMTSHRPSRPP